MPLQPSRRDILGPPPRDVSDLANIVRHHGSYLDSLNPGILGGRFKTPRPVGSGPSQIVGDDGGDGDAEAVIGEDGDRLTLANLDTQVWTLSYTPISETLVVRWHPDAGAGVEWKRGEHYELAEDDQIVTIYASALASGRAQVGDVFSAQYLRLDGEEDDLVTPPGPATATLRGTHSSHYSGGSLPTTFSLPVGTQVGDLIAIATNGDVTDSRMTYVGGGQSGTGGGLYMGWATSLGDLTVDMSTSRGLQWAIACMTMETNAVGWTTASDAFDTSMTAGDTMTVPQIFGVSAAICGVNDYHSIVDGATTGPTDYTVGTGSGSAKKSARVALWVDTAIGTSPAGPIGFNGGSGEAEAIVVGLIGP
jgi:hypothetical protein